jgi:hypothetical protein
MRAEVRRICEHHLQEEVRRILPAEWKWRLEETLS